MTDLAERIRELCANLCDSRGHVFREHAAELGQRVWDHEETILAGLAALEERDKLRALCDQAAAMVDSLAYGSYAENSQVGRLVQRLKAAALQPTPETTKEK